MLTMVHMEMLFVPPIHQPIVAPPAVRVGDAIFKIPGPGFRPVAASWRRLRRFPCGLSRGVPESRSNRFTPSPTPFFPRTRRPPKH